MPTFEYTVEIDAPIEYVFAWGADPMNWPKVMPSLRDLEIVEETDDGYVMDATYKMLGIAMDGDMTFEVVEDLEYTVTTFDSDGMAGELHYHYREIDDATEVVQHADYEFGDSLLERIIEPVAKRYNARQFKNALINSKELIEAEYEAEMEAEATPA